MSNILRELLKLAGTSLKVESRLVNTKDANFLVYLLHFYDRRNRGMTAIKSPTRRKKYLERLTQDKATYKEKFSDMKVDQILRSKSGFEDLERFMTKNFATSDAYTNALTVLEFLVKIPLRSTSNKGYTKSPLETLLENNGDKKDHTVLGAILLKTFGISSAVIDYDGETLLGMAVGEEIAQKAEARNSNSVVKLNDTKYLAIDISKLSPKIIEGKSISEESLSSRSLYREKIETFVYEAKNPATCIVDSNGKITVLGRESRIEVVEHPRLITRYIDKLRHKKRSKGFNISYLFEDFFASGESHSFFYSIDVEEYLAASQIKRDASNRLLNKHEHMKLIPIDNRHVQEIINHVFSLFYPNKNYDEVNEFDRARLGMNLIHKFPYSHDPTWDYPKHTIELLAEGTGDCEDLANGLVSFHTEMKLQAVLFNLKGHVSTGVHIPERQERFLGRYNQGIHIQIDGKKFYFCETTGTTWPDKPATWKIGSADERYLKRENFQQVLRVSKE